MKKYAMPLIATTLAFLMLTEFSLPVSVKAENTGNSPIVAEEKTETFNRFVGKTLSLYDQINGTALKEIPAGTELTLTNNDGTWSKTTYNDEEGFVKNANLSLEKPKPTTTEIKKKDKIIRYAGTALNLRESNSTDSNALTLIPIGTELTLLSNDGTWSKVDYEGKNGFVKNSFLQVVYNPPEEVAQNENSEYLEHGEPTGYTYTISDLKLRSEPNTQSNTITVIPDSTKIEVLEEKGEWTAVHYEDASGYVKNEYVDETPTLYTTSKVNLRADTTTNSNALTTVPLNAEITVVEGGKQWDKVEFDGQTGYIKNEYLTTAKAEETSGTAEYATWSEVKQNFTIGVDAKVVDLYTGKVYYVRSFSNGSHADVEPVTKNDTATMKETFGSWSWDVRPVSVTINGRTFAGSINGMPHGGGVNGDNGMNGQICIHFIGSKTHNGNQNYTQLHQDVAKEAYNLLK
ncbi:MAG: SH3 domain-containing protein [Lachnospirales bacterium]